MEYNELKNKSTEELLMEYNSLKKDIIYMESCLNDKNISLEQKSEFMNSDVPYTREQLEKIEEVLNTRKSK